MATPIIKEKAQALLALAEKLVHVPGLTWVDASNIVFSPGGPYARLFGTAAERAAFCRSKECVRIDELIGSLPEPPVRAEPKDEYTGKRVIEIIPISAR